MRNLRPSAERPEREILLVEMCADSQAASHASQAPPERSCLPLCRLRQGFSARTPSREPVGNGAKDDEASVSQIDTGGIWTLAHRLHKVLSWICRSWVVYPLPALAFDEKKQAPI